MRKRFLAVAALLLALGTCAHALNPSLDISQYAHNSWTISQGFCKGLIRAMAQTPDGYLWVGSEFGLVRFDGVRCVPWPPPTHQQLSNTYIDSLVATRDGTLWIGTHGGLASLKKGKLTEYPEFAGQEVGPLLEDREGTVWVGTGHQSLVGKLCAVRGNSVHCYADSRFGNGVFSLYEDSGGELWVAAVNGLWRWKPGPPKLYPMPDRVLAFTEVDNGALLAVMRGGIVQLAAGRVEPFTLPEVAGLLDNLLRDRDGGLWIVGQYGLLHVHQGRTDMFSKSDGLSGDNILALLEDREGNIWAATENGLDRFRDLAVVTVSAKQGFYDTNHTDAVLGASDGSIWVGTLDRLNRWKHGQITVYRRSHKGSSRPSEPVVNGGLTHEITDTALPDEIAGRSSRTIAGEFGYLQFSDSSTLKITTL
jgi:ligand-binding sensor domain-containing protein